MRGGWTYPRMILVVLTLVTALVLVGSAATSSATFGIYNRAWDGGATLQGTADNVGADSAIIRNVSAVDEYPSNRTLMVVIAPETNYSGRDVDTLSRFVRSGGTILVADEFGTRVNPLLADLGAQARIDGRTLRDERYHFRSPALPVARNVSNHTLTTDVSRLTLNHGSVVRPNGATVLVASSEYAYLDANGNATLDSTEVVASYPVVTVESVGEGAVVVVSDPSLFINAMVDRTGNRKFTQNAFSLFEYVLFDYSHVTRLPPLAWALLAVRGSSLLQVVVGSLGITAIGVWARRPEGVKSLSARMQPQQPPYPLQPDRTDIEAAIRYEHPEWDDERVHRMIQGIKTSRTNEGNND